MNTGEVGELFANYGFCKPKQHNRKVVVQIIFVVSDVKSARSKTEMFFIKGSVVGTDIYGNVKKKLIKRQEITKPDMMHIIEDADIPGLVNVKLALLDLYDGKTKIDDIEFMADDVDSCEADNFSSL